MISVYLINFYAKEKEVRNNVTGKIDEDYVDIFFEQNVKKMFYCSDYCMINSVVIYLLQISIKKNVA